MIIEFNVEYGGRYRDVVTGFEGVCTAVSAHVTGCLSALIVPGVDKEGKLVDGQWMDIARLRCASGEPIRIVTTVEQVESGGDIDPPQRY